MTDEKNWWKPIPPEYEHLFDGNVWHGFKDGGMMIELFESNESPGCWHIYQYDLSASAVDETIQPYPKFIVATILRYMGHPLEAYEWRRSSKRIDAGEVTLPSGNKLPADLDRALTHMCHMLIRQRRLAHERGGDDGVFEMWVAILADLNGVMAGQIGVDKALRVNAILDQVWQRDERVMRREEDEVIGRLQ